MASSSSSSGSGSWSRWPSLLAPHPDPRPFARTNRVYSAASTSTSPSRPSASTSLSPSRTAPSSLSGFFTTPTLMSRSASNLGVDDDNSRSQSRSRSRSGLRLLKGKSKSKPNLKARSPPPSLEPLSFPSEPIIDLGSLRSFSFSSRPRTPSPPPPVPPLPPGIHSHGHGQRNTPHRKYHSEPNHPDNHECHNELGFASHDGDDGRRRLAGGLVQPGNYPSSTSQSVPCAPWASRSPSTPNAHVHPRGSTSPPPAHPQIYTYSRPEAEVARQAESSRDIPIPPPRAAEIQKRTSSVTVSGGAGTYSTLTLSSAPFPHPPLAQPPDAPASRLQRKASTLSAISISSRRSSGSGSYKLKNTKRRPPLPPVPPTPTSPDHPHMMSTSQQCQEEGGFPFPDVDASTSTKQPRDEGSLGSTSTAPMPSSRSPSPLPIPPVSDAAHCRFDSPLEARSDCGHGTPATTSSTNPLTSPNKRTSLLLRHFSLTTRSSSPSHPKPKRTGTGSRPTSPPPSSWADVACPHPTSSTTNSTLTATSTTASTSISAPLSRSGSVSDFSAKLRRWSIRRGKQSADGSGCSSRTSLEDENEAAKKDAVGRVKGKERAPLIRVVSTGSVHPRESDLLSLHYLNPARSSALSTTESQQMPSICSSQQRTHKRSTSWGDAAVALFRGASFTSISGESRRNSKEKERPKTMESSYKGRAIVDLTKDEGVVSQEPSPSPRRAKFTLGECDSDADLPSSSTSAPLSPPTITSTTAAPTSPRPPFARRDALISETERKGRQRWTLARAVADEGISEAALVRELERLRAVRSWGVEGRRRRRVMSEGGNAGEGVGVGVDEDEDCADEMWDEWDVDGWGVEREVFEGVEEEERRERTQVLDGALRDSPTESSESEPILHPSPSRSPSHTWLATRRALLICRELIQTERHYLASLRALVAQDTASPPPPLMLHYASEVLRASAGVLAGMEREPGMRGVARAFVDRAEEVDGAYVRWCGVVGGWFADGAEEGEEGHVVKRKRSRTNHHRTSVPGVDGEGEEGSGKEREVASPPVSPLKRTVSTWRRSMPSIPSLGLGEAHHANESAPPAPRSARKPTVRDLAILPTQRVMRYVLLYRDLLAHTPPTSSARPIIERAVDAACRIAEKCDRAQNNAAFVAHSGSSNSNTHTNATLLVTAGTSPSTSSSRSSSRREPPSRAESPSAQTTASSASNSTTTSNSSNSSSSSASSASSALTSITTPSSSPVVNFPSAAEKLVKGPSAFRAGAGGAYTPTTEQTRTKRRMSASATMFKSLGWGKGRPGSSGGHPQPPLPLPLPLRSITIGGGGSGTMPMVVRAEASS
ncbi:unnamed protein product [Cyclocybe aegerita]|uniref:DH domain-containing protein n=1 Tax=Cyclocybe aegerita TaxID=1973307 RepID=A0A8S0W074_CYCAE|nr:unnamed protein product [Cyclocybe aegerita]